MATKKTKKRTASVTEKPTTISVGEDAARNEYENDRRKELASWSKDTLITMLLATERELEYFKKLVANQNQNQIVFHTDDGIYHTPPQPTPIPPVQINPSSGDEPPWWRDPKRTIMCHM